VQDNAISILSRLVGDVWQSHSIVQTSGVVSRQWKTAVITPIPKIAMPSRPSHFRSANIDHAGPLADARAIRCPKVYLPGFITTASVTRLQRPVRVQAIWLDDGCSRGDASATHRAHYAGR